MRYGAGGAAIGSRRRARRRRRLLSPLDAFGARPSLEGSGDGVVALTRTTTDAVRGRVSLRSRPVGIPLDGIRPTACRPPEPDVPLRAAGRIGRNQVEPILASALGEWQPDGGDRARRSISSVRYRHRVAVDALEPATSQPDRRVAGRSIRSEQKDHEALRCRGAQKGTGPLWEAPSDRALGHPRGERDRVQTFTSAPVLASKYMV
jgi:hypothetical protein